MQLDAKVKEMLDRAMEFTRSNNYEYITPEIVLRALCDTDIFAEAFENCGGDIKKLRGELEKNIERYSEKIKDTKCEFSDGMGSALMWAAQSALSSESGSIGIRHVVYGIWCQENSYAVYYMKMQEVDKPGLLSELTALEDTNDHVRQYDSEDDEDDMEEYAEADDPDDEDDENPDDDDVFDDDEDEENDGDIADAGQIRVKEEKKKRSSKDLERYAPCLNDVLKDINPLIGRENELERTIQILARKDKNNPLHIGEPGVGKTAITYGLVQRIREGKVPDELKGSRIYSLDLGGMLAGTQYRGDFEKRMKKVLEELEREDKPILFIDEIHNISGSGATGDSSFDAGNLLKPYLMTGKLKVIGATTFEEYKKHFEKNKSLARRFQNIEITEPSEAETIEILKGLRSKYEEFHKIVYTDEALEYAVTMSAKHLNERFLPDKAIDLIDEAGAFKKLHPDEGKPYVVDKDIINLVLTKICRVPFETVKTDEAEGLKTLEDRIKKKIFGQDEAVAQVVNAIKFSRAGLLEENKPLASLLFVGPTGVGKTEIARTLAEEMGVKLVRFDMSEYEEKHTVAKLIGAPAGYVGYEEGGLLTEEIRKNPHAVLLLDEIEKAHADIYNVLLQVMDYATLSDNQGRKADFRNVVLIMTSNAGANRIGKKEIGFESTAGNSGVIMEEVKKTFQPEFRNRLNRIVVFRGMDEAMATDIIGKKLGELKQMLSQKSIELDVSGEAFVLIREKGISEEFGAREIDRVIRNEVKPLLVDEVLFGKLKDGGKAVLSVKDGGFTIDVS